MAYIKLVDGEWKLIVRCCFVEFLGDLFFIFIGTLQAIFAMKFGILVTAFAHGIMMSINIMAMGHISGGHFNPAVTLGVFVSGNIALLNAFCYIVSQLIGGLIGSFLARACISEALFEAIGGGATVPGTDYWGQALVCEIILTYILVNSVLCAAVDTDSNVLAPLTIGLSIFVDILAGGSISGASMNPARSLGPAIVSDIFGLSTNYIWKMHYVYYVGPFIGGALAAVIYKTFLAKDEKRWIL